MLCPLYSIVHFYISPLSCYFNLAKATEGKLPKDYLRVELSKKSAYPAIDFHFSLFLTRDFIPRRFLAVFWLFPGPPEYSVRRFHFCISEMKHFHRRRESNWEQSLSLKMKWRRKKKTCTFWLVLERMRETQWEQITAKMGSGTYVDKELDLLNAHQRTKTIAVPNFTCM